MSKTPPELPPESSSNQDAVVNLYVDRDAKLQFVIERPDGTTETKPASAQDALAFHAEATRLHEMVEGPGDPSLHEQSAEEVLFGHLQLEMVRDEYKRRSGENPDAEGTS